MPADTSVEVAFDHGMLQIPLAKRQGDIDAKIDAYKATQARELKASLRAGWSLQRQARAAVRDLSTDRLAQLGKPHNLTAKQALAMMLSAADSRPELTLRTLAKEA